MLSIQQCKKILEKNGAKYTEDQIIGIRDLFYRLAEIDYQNFIQIKQDGTEKALIYTRVSTDDQVDEVLA